MSKWKDLGKRSELCGPVPSSPHADEHVYYPSVHLDNQKTAPKPGELIEVTFKAKVRSVTKQDTGNFSCSLDLMSMKSDSDSAEKEYGSDQERVEDLLEGQLNGKKKS